MEKAIRIHQRDSVAVALEELKAGERVLGVTLKEDVPPGHKLALRAIEKGSDVIKYGEPIGRATADIEAGTHVHVHNLSTRLSGQLEYTYEPVDCSLEKAEPDSFMGFVRENGRVGIRNEIWIIPTVGCVNGTAKRLEAQAKSLPLACNQKVVSFEHPYGCSQMGDDQEATRHLIAALCEHPNAGGVLLLGLGCENSGVAEIEKLMDNPKSPRFRSLVCQQAEDEEQEGLRLIGELMDYASGDRRTAVPTSELIVGLKCGGSDGLSGVTANPLIGAFSDRLVAHGGSTILTEVPEMFGAETLLMARCKNEAVFKDTVELINGFKGYYEEHNQTIYENPSPGNKAGGISTLEDKALGCTQKSGSSPVVGVLGYTERIKERGLNLLCAPGNDLVASTALAVSGAQLVLFSTGRGTPFGCPVPTVKLSTNTALAEKKGRWIDFDAGRLLSGLSMAELSEEFYNYVLGVASGKETCNEKQGIQDLAIFKRGVTL